MRVQRKQFHTEVRAADGDRRLRFVISTGDEDREGDTINPEGWVLDNYRRNPVVLWAHDHSALPVAKAHEISAQDGRLIAVAEFATHDFADEVYQLYRERFLRATSVGFRPLEWSRNEAGGVDFLEQELVEFSCVPVPANPNALIAAAGKPTPQLRRWAREVLDQGDAERITRAIIAGARRAADRRHPKRQVLEIDTGATALEIEPTINLTPGQISAATHRAVGQALREFINEQVDAAVGYQRGRVR